jgi:hypothetical protein
MAYIFVRSADLKPSTSGTVDWAVRIGKAASRALGREVVVMTPRAGNLARVAWTFRAESWAELEHIDATLEKDAEYRQVRDEGRGHGYVTRVEDAVFTVVS